MMFNDFPCAQVGAIGNRVTVCDDDDGKSPLGRRTNSGIHAHIGGPASNQYPLRLKVRQVRIERRTDERAVEALANETIVWFRFERIQNLPTGGVGGEGVTGSTIVLNEENAASALSNLCSEVLDSRDHSREVMLRIALKDPALHVDNEKCFHTRVALPPTVWALSRTEQG